MSGVEINGCVNLLLLLLLSAAPLRVATADISAQKIWQCFTPDALPDATY